MFGILKPSKEIVWSQLFFSLSLQCFLASHAQAKHWILGILKLATTPEKYWGKGMKKSCNKRHHRCTIVMKCNRQTPESAELNVYRVWLQILQNTCQIFEEKNLLIVFFEVKDFLLLIITFFIPVRTVDDTASSSFLQV